MVYTILLESPDAAPVVETGVVADPVVDCQRILLAFLATHSGSGGGGGPVAAPAWTTLTITFTPEES